MSSEKTEPLERRFVEKGLVARPIGAIGWGLFSDTHFYAGEPIFWLDSDESSRGQLVLSWEAFGDCDERAASILPDFSFCCLIDHPFWNVNHSCEGNSGFGDWGRFESGKVPFMAHRDIAPGEQINSDYSLFTAYYDGSPQGDSWELRGCLCGTPSCRERITGFRALSQDLQLKGMLPKKAPFGRVPAHILEEEAHLVELLKPHTTEYWKYVDVLHQQYDISKYLHKKFGTG